MAAMAVTPPDLSVPMPPHGPVAPHDPVLAAAGDIACDTATP